MIRYNTLIVLMGVGLLGAAAGPIGAFAVLRRRALVGDALAHATLPGLCIAFLLAGEKNLVWMLLGALGKGWFAVTVVVLVVMGRTAPFWLSFVAFDGTWVVVFLIAFARTPAEKPASIPIEQTLTEKSHQLLADHH